VSLSEIRSDSFSCFLEVSCEEFTVGVQTGVVYETFKFFALRVDVLDSFIDSVLTNIFSWERVSIRSSNSQRDCEVHEIDVFLSPLLEIPHKSVEVMSLWQVISTALVKSLDLLHESESHVLVINVQNYAWTSLMNALRQLNFHELVKHLISIPCIVFVEHIQEVPPVINGLFEMLSLSESVEFFISQVSNIKVDLSSHAFFLHPRASVAEKAYIIVATHLLQTPHQLGPNQVGLARVSEDTH